MVYKDISDAVSFQNNKPTLFRAAILDRVFSFLLDYLIFSPVVSFFLLSLLQDEVSMWKNSLNSAENFAGFVLIAVSYVMIFSLLQSFFIFFWGATPGQYFLKLKIEMNSRAGLRFFRILLRQIGFWVSPLFLGFPWLAVLSHPSQQTFYDLISESSVRSFKEKQDYFAFEIEIKYWQSLVATLTLFLALLMVGFGYQQHQRIKMAAFTFVKAKQKNSFCSELKSIELKDRLQTAVALNLVGQLSDECVDKEADFTLWTMKNDELKSLAYYAKSLTENDPKVEEKYLTHACGYKDKKYLGCQVASAFLKQNYSELYQTLKKDASSEIFLNQVLKYELGMILEKTTDQQANFMALKKFDRPIAIKKYLIGEVLDARQAVIQSGNSRSGRKPASEMKPVDLKQWDYAKQLIDEM